MGAGSVGREANRNPVKEPKRLRANLAKRTAQFLKKRRDSKGDFGSQQMSREMRLKAGLRPRYPGKVDHWNELTAKQRERILARSREHLARQRLLGIPEDELYGPVMVLEKGVRWESRITTTVGID